MYIKRLYHSTFTYIGLANTIIVMPIKHLINLMEWSYFHDWMRLPDSSTVFRYILIDIMPSQKSHIPNIPKI